MAKKQPTVEAEILESNVEEKVEEKKVKKIKPIKNINVKQCITTFIFCACLLAIICIVPYSFGNSGIKLTILSVFDGTMKGTQEFCAGGLALLFSMSSANTFAMLFKIAFLSFLIILALNILFSLFLAIFRVQCFRLIFKIYSIIAGFTMIFVLAMSLLHVVGFFGYVIQGVIELESIMDDIETSAIIPMILTAIFSGILIFKQMKWFSRLY